ncbi:hypothetical protein M758_5G005400 [Ceratodon purpureus]|nr:hypothetical protein M758_5G005400 [Ceratodon purpureus]
MCCNPQFHMPAQHSVCPCEARAHTVARLTYIISSCSHAAVVVVVVVVVRVSVRIGLRHPMSGRAGKAGQGKQAGQGRQGRQGRESRQGRAGQGRAGAGREGRRECLKGRRESEIPKRRRSRSRSRLRLMGQGGRMTE